MLNRVVLMGRITHDLEVRQTPSGQPVLSFSVAVQRNFKDQNGEYQSDFINCVAWRQQAEFISRFFGKGRMICIEGNLRTRTYEDKNGTKHHVTEVFVDSAQFTGEPKQQGGTYQSNYGNGGYQQQGGYQQGGQGGYQQQSGGYQQGGYQGGNNGYNGGSQGSQSSGGDALSIGDLSDFEDVLSDDGVPF